MFTDNLSRFLLQYYLIYAFISPCSLAEDADNSEHIHAHLKEIYREQLIPDLGGKIPSAAFDWTRLVFNNLDSRGISIPDGIPSSDRLSDGRSDEKRLTLTSDSTYASEIPSTYIMRNPVKFTLWPNPQEKPEDVGETHENESFDDDASFLEWNTGTETCKAPHNCKNDPVNESEEDTENKQDDEVHMNNYDPMEHQQEEPHLLSRHRKPQFMKNSENKKRQNEAEENKNLHYDFPGYSTTTRFRPSTPSWRTSKVVSTNPFPISSHLHHHNRDFHHRLALNYILSNLRKHPETGPKIRSSINNPTAQKPSLMTVVFTPAVKIDPKKVKRNSVHNVLRELLTF